MCIMHSYLSTCTVHTLCSVFNTIQLINTHHQFYIFYYLYAKQLLSLIISEHTLWIFRSFLVYGFWWKQQWPMCSFISSWILLTESLVLLCDTISFILAIHICMQLYAFLISRDCVSLFIIFTSTYTPPPPTFRQHYLSICSMRTRILFVCEIFDRIFSLRIDKVYMYIIFRLLVVHLVFYNLFSFSCSVYQLVRVLLSILCSIFFFILLIYCIIAVTINCHATQFSNHFFIEVPVTINPKSIDGKKKSKKNCNA